MELLLDLLASADFSKDQKAHRMHTLWNLR